MAVVKASPDFQIYCTAQEHAKPFQRSDQLALPAESAGGDNIQITINVDSERQELEGFGGAITEASAVALSRLSVERRAEAIQGYFHPELGLGYTFCRTHMNSCDFSLGNYSCDGGPSDPGLEHFSIDRDRRYLIPLLRDAYEASGGRLRNIVTPWSPPGWMKTSGTMNHGGKLKPECRDVWARYFAKFIAAYAEEGLPIWGVSVQNEPRANQVWESCLWTEEEECAFVRDQLGPCLAGAGYGHVKILIHDHNKDDLYDRASSILSDPVARGYIWGSAFHWYRGDHFEQLSRLAAEYPDKRLYFTEGCQEGGVHRDAWEVGERYGHEYIGDIAHGTHACIDWNIVLDERGGPNHKGNFCAAPILADGGEDRLIYQNAYYYIGHFSRFIRPGARCLDLDVSEPLLEGMAYKNTDGTIGSVIMNTRDEAQVFALQCQDEMCSILSPARSILTVRQGRSRA